MIEEQFNTAGFADFFRVNTNKLVYLFIYLL